MSTTSETHPRRVRAILLESTIVAELALGKSYGTIQRELGISKRTLASALQRAVEKHKKLIGESLAVYQALELATLDRLLLCLSPKIAEGNVNACQCAIQILQRRAACLGTDAPRRLETKNENHNTVSLPMDPNEVIAEIRRHAADLTTGSQPKRSRAPALTVASMPALPAPEIEIDAAPVDVTVPLPPAEAEVSNADPGDDADDDTDAMIDPPPDAADQRNGHVDNDDVSEPPVRPVRYKQWCESLGRHVHVLPPKN